MKYLIIFLSLFFFGACQDNTEVHYNIGGEIRTYVDKFIEEGSIRGQNMSIEHLTAILVDQFSLTDPYGFCGYGWHDYKGTGVSRIEILNSPTCWQNRSEMEKENFIFHELGHALLMRTHKQDTMSKGYMASLMCGGRPKIENCSNYQTYYQTPDMRDYYLDELFNPSTMEPSWVDRNTFIRNLFTDNIGRSLDHWELVILNDSLNQSDYEFLIDSTGIFSTNSIGISVGSNPKKDAGGFLNQTFSIDHFPDCSSIKVGSHLKTMGLTNGTLSLGLSLSNVDENGNRHDIFTFRKNTINFIDGQNTALETEVLCLPLSCNSVTVTVYLESKTAAAVYFDDFKVDLWN